MALNAPQRVEANRIAALPSFIFASRWLQLPLYLGLIVAQSVYVFHFWVEPVHLVETLFGNQDALAQMVSSIGYKSEVQVSALNETIIMLVVFSLIDVVLISNLLIIAIIGISSIYLIKTFINAANYTGELLIWQTLIHIASLFSALAIAYAERLMAHTAKPVH